MAWETFNTRRRDYRYGPYAVTPDRCFSAEVILIQRDETGRTRVVLGFLVGAEYVSAERIPGWTGEFARSMLISTQRDGRGLFRSVPDATYRVAPA